MSTEKDQFEQDLHRNIAEQLDDGFDDDYEPDEFEEAMYDCHGFFDPNPETGHFTCGAAGSEDCDECPMSSWCGLTNKQIDKLEDAHDR